MTDQEIKLSKWELQVVEEQCKKCKHWRVKTGCMHPEALDHQPVYMCNFAPGARNGRTG